MFKVQDYYFKKAKKENFLARSIYKLEEIDQRFHILKAGQHVLDLGYHPGSWVQYAAGCIGPQGLVVGIDIKEINKTLAPLKNVTLFEKDIFDVHGLADLGVTTKFDVMLSDMAPNTSGIKSLDQIRSMNLVEMVFGTAPQFLKHGGQLVAKVFDSNDVQIFLKTQRSLFREFHFLKPKSTRTISKEFFVIGKGFLL